MKIYGYDKIATVANHTVGDMSHHDMHDMNIKTLLASRGLNECRSFGFGNLAIEQITLLLRQRHRLKDDTEDDFQIMDMKQIMETMNTVTGYLKLLLIAQSGTNSNGLSHLKI